MIKTKSLLSITFLLKEFEHFEIEKKKKRIEIDRKIEVQIKKKKNKTEYSIKN